MNNWNNPLTNPMSQFGPGTSTQSPHPQGQVRQNTGSVDPIQAQQIVHQQQQMQQLAQARDAALRQLAIEVYLTQLRKGDSWKIDDCYKVAAGLIGFDVTKLNDPNF